MAVCVRVYVSFTGATVLQDPWCHSSCSAHVGYTYVVVNALLFGDFNLKYFNPTTNELCYGSATRYTVVSRSWFIAGISSPGWTKPFESVLSPIVNGNPQPWEAYAVHASSGAGTLAVCAAMINATTPSA